MGARIEVSVRLDAFLICYHTLNKFCTPNPISLKGPGLLSVVLSHAGREVSVISCSESRHDGVASLASTGDAPYQRENAHAFTAQ